VEVEHALPQGIAVSIAKALTGVLAQTLCHLGDDSVAGRIGRLKAAQRSPILQGAAHHLPLVLIGVAHPQRTPGVAAGHTNLGAELALGSTPHIDDVGGVTRAQRLKGGAVALDGAGQRGVSEGRSVWPRHGDGAHHPLTAVHRVLSSVVSPVAEASSRRARYSATNCV